MEELRTTYEKLYGAPVPVNKKNDEERIKAKIAEANVEDVEEDEGTKELENKTPTQKKSPSNNVTPKTSAPYIPSIHEKRNLEKVAKFNI